MGKMYRRIIKNLKRALQEICSNSTKRKQFQLDLMEAFLWLIVLSLLIIIYLPELSEFFSSLFRTHTYSQRNTDSSYINQRTLFHYKVQLELSMHLVVESTETSNSSMVLANHTTGKFYVLPEKYRWSPRRISLVNEKKSELDTESTSLGKSSGNYSKAQLFMQSQTIRIKCSAPFPVEIVYKGNARPRFGTISVEKSDSLDYFNQEPIFTVTLHFEKPQLEEMDTGRYTCQAVDMRNLTEEDVDKRRKFIEIFVPGETKLLHGSLQRIDDRDFSPSIIDPIIVYHDVTANGEYVTLPCGVSDPSTSVKLYFKESQDSEPVVKDYRLIFDELNGFQVPLQLMKDDSGRYSRNHFVCKTNDGNNWESELAFKVLIKDGRNSRVTPNVTQVAILPHQLPVQLFECESNEPVVITWLDNSDLSVLTTVRRKPSVTYTASFIATPKHISGTHTSSVTRFQCSRVSDGVIIHIWEWVGNGVTSPYLSYNGKRKELSCCMNSFHAPHLLVEACSTMLECQVRASFQTKIASSGVTPATRQGCRVWTVPKEFRAGLVMCDVANVNPFTHPSRKKELPPVLLQWNNRVVVIGGNGVSSQPLESLITMNVSTNTMNDGLGRINHIVVECRATSMMFANGFRFTIYMASGIVMENVQQSPTWGGGEAVSFEEDFDRRNSCLRGVLILSRTMYVKPLLKVGHIDEKGPAAQLQLTNTISKIKCEAPLWNDTTRWIETTVDIGRVVSEVKS